MISIVRIAANSLVVLKTDIGTGVTSTDCRRSLKMLLVKTHLGNSSIAGVGLFIDETVPAGTIIWEEHALTDRRYTPAELEELRRLLPTFQFQDFSRFMYFLHGYWILNLDDSRFMNHASASFSNLAYDRERDICFAIRQICAGEELTIDYRSFCDRSDDPVCRECGLCDTLD